MTKVEELGTEAATKKQLEAIVKPALPSVREQKVKNQKGTSGGLFKKIISGLFSDKGAPEKTKSKQKKPRPAKNNTGRGRGGSLLKKKKTLRSTRTGLNERQAKADKKENSRSDRRQGKRTRRIKESGQKFSKGK